MFQETKKPVSLCKTVSMIIDIRRTAIRMRLRGLITTVIFSIVIIIIMIAEFFDANHYGISRSYLVLFFSVIYLVFILYVYLKDYYYIYFSDEGNKIIFRYYSMRPLSQAKRSIEIPRGNFARYEIKTDSFGLKNKIILYQKVKGGVYKYPPVSITALSPHEKNQLIQALNKLL
jgi:hypothetical protein